MAIDGTWDVTINSPMGAQQGQMNLTVDGASLTGNMSGAQGTLEIEDGAADGDSFTCAINLTQPMPIKLEVSASVDGDAMTGEVKLGAFGTATLEGSRA